MANVGPSRFEANLDKSMRRHGPKLVVLALATILGSLGFMSGDYLDSYEGVIVEIKAEDFNYRGRKNKGLSTVERFCLVMQVDGESEPRINCKLKPSVLRSFKAGDRFRKPRFVNRPLAVAVPSSAPEGSAAPPPRAGQATTAESPTTP